MGACWWAVPSKRRNSAASRLPALPASFANEGDITIHATDRINLTQLVLTGNLKVNSTRGSIFIDMTSAVISAVTHPQPVGSVTLTAGGTYEQKRFYYGGPFDGDTGVVTQPDVVRTGPVAVRVRRLRSNGPITIDGQVDDGRRSCSMESSKPQGDVTLNAPSIRARHSVFATGGDITVGGKLIVEPWGDEIVVTGSVGGRQNDKVYSQQYLPERDGPIPTAPGSTLTAAPASRAAKLEFTFHCKEPCGDDLASSQITLRATRVGSAGGQVTLTSGAGREEGISDDLAAMRTDQQHVRLDRGAVTKSLFSTDTETNNTDGEFQTKSEKRGRSSDVPRDRSVLPLVPLNDVRLNLQADAAVVFKAAFQVDDSANKTFRFFGVPVDPLNGQPPNADPPFSNPVFRLTVLDSAGKPVPGLDENGTPLQSTPATFTVEGATARAQSFSGSLQSYNDQERTLTVVNDEPTGLPGAVFASERHEITGQPPPPGPTPAAPPPPFRRAFEYLIQVVVMQAWVDATGGLGNLGTPRDLQPARVPPPPGEGGTDNGGGGTGGGGGGTTDRWWWWNGWQDHQH